MPNKYKRYAKVTSIAPPPLLTYRTLVLAYTYHPPSRRSFACFFDTALSFVSYSMVQPSLSHVQNDPYYVLYRFLAPFYIPFRSILSPFCKRRNANARTVQRSLYEDEPLKFLLTATVYVTVSDKRGHSTQRLISSTCGWCEVCSIMRCTNF